MSHSCEGVICSSYSSSKHSKPHLQGCFLCQRRAVWTAVPGLLPTWHPSSDKHIVRNIDSLLKSKSVENNWTVSFGLLSSTQLNVSHTYSVLNPKTLVKSNHFTPLQLSSCVLQVKEKKTNLPPKNVWQPARNYLGNMQSMIQQVNHPTCSKIAKKCKATDNPACGKIP